MEKKKVIAIISAAVLSAALITGCSGNKSNGSAADAPTSASSSQASSTQSRTDNGSTNMANPFTECENIEEASKIAGFRFEIPEASQYTVTASNNLIDVQVQDGDNASISYRKCSDLSYAKYYESIIDGCEYKASDDERLAKLESTALGINNDGNVQTAYFSDNKYAYSIHWDNAVSVDKAINSILLIWMMN